MAYGRLDVYWPDGRFQTFSLSEPSISLGRSTGNSIALETDNLSRYHLSLAYEDGQVYITDLDSANGTYVDGVRLEGSKPQPLYGGEEIQIGELRIIYFYLDESPTRPIVPLEDTTERIELEAPLFRIDLMGPEQAVSPGAHISVEVTITNTGKDKERFTVDVTGIPREWVRIDRPELEIAPGKSSPVVLNFKPSRKPDSAPGDYNVTVIVQPKRESVTMLRGDFTLHVLPYRGFGIAIESNKLTEDGQFKLHLHNQGSAPLPLTITLRDLEDAKLKLNMASPRITLGPGQRTVVKGSVTQRQKQMFGDEETYPFDLLIRSGDPSGFLTATRAYLTVKPSMPRWAPVAGLSAIGALAIVVLIGVIVLFLSATRPQPPQVTTFLVSSTRVAQGSPVVVNWDGSNLDGLTLNINQTPVYTTGDGTSFTVDTASLAGDIALEMVSNGEVLAREYVHVVRPLSVQTFTASPPQLVRNVVQPITLEWNVPGASFTRLGGLENFTTTALEPTYGAAGRLADLVGIPQTDLLLTIYAEANDGRIAEHAITIPVVDPTCVPARGAVVVRVGPRESDQVIGTVPEGRTVVVDALDNTGQWLRVILSGGVRGWGPLTSFTCASFFDPRTLRQALDIPTAVPPTPTIGPTERIVTATPRPTGTVNPTPERIITATPTPRRTTSPGGG